MSLTNNLSFRSNVALQVNVVAEPSRSSIGAFPILGSSRKSLKAVLVRPEICQRNLPEILHQGPIVFDLHELAMLESIQILGRITENFCDVTDNTSIISNLLTERAARAPEAG